VLKLKQGDLVHVPSSATLINKSNKQPTTYMRLREPKKLLVVEEKDAGSVGVIYDGAVWYVDERDVYLTGDNDE
jgi:hypothetical protein